MAATTNEEERWLRLLEGLRLRERLGGDHDHSNAQRLWILDCTPQKVNRTIFYRRVIECVRSSRSASLTANLFIVSNRYFVGRKLLKEKPLFRPGGNPNDSVKYAAHHTLFSAACYSYSGILEYRQHLRM